MSHRSATGTTGAPCTRSIRLKQHGHPFGRPDVHALRRPLTRLGIGLDRCHRQTQGDDIDIDAAVEARVEMMAGSAPDEAVYLDSLRRRRDLSVLRSARRLRIRPLSQAPPARPCTSNSARRPPR